MSDDGNGFTDEALERASEPYFTEEDKTKGGHYGLGLAICRELCEKLEGRISCGNDNGAIVRVEV